MEMDWQASGDGCLVTYRENLRPNKSLRWLWCGFPIFFTKK